MLFSINSDRKVLIYIIFVTILLSLFPLISTLNRIDLFYQVIPFTIGITAICLVIGIGNHLFWKNGYLIALSWIFNPILWFVFGAGSIWYIRIIGLDWFWWVIYPGIYCLFLILQPLVSDWWQVHDKLIVKISMIITMIMPILAGGRYSRYNIRFVDSQIELINHSSLKITDVIMLLLFTICGFGIILFSGRNLWQRAVEYENKKAKNV